MAPAGLPVLIQTQISVHVCSNLFISASRLPSYPLLVSVPSVLSSLLWGLISGFWRIRKIDLLKRFCVLFVSVELKHFFFYSFKVFCIVLAIGSKNKACFSLVWLESSCDLPHNNLAFPSLTQPEISKLLRRKQILFMGIHKPLLCSNLDARSKTFLLQVSNRKFQTEL